MSSELLEVARAFLLHFLSFRVPLVSTAMSDQHRWLTLHVAMDFLRQSLWRFSMVPLSLWSVNSSPYMVIFGK